ncbi:uncharacterized protein [Hemitrygon akajei]|uniref:uncharacterized protein n=1 Tax=Hemitrygon akajei TaxID=2704970 RepID=UPI003BF959E9
MERILRPDRLDIDPQSPEAGIAFELWLAYFKSYLEKIRVTAAATMHRVLLSRKYSKKKQDSPNNLIPSSTNILVDPPKKHQIYLIDTLIPETWKDLAAESEVAFREQSSSRNNKAQQFTGGQHAVHSPKHESSDIIAELDKSSLSPRSSSSVQQIDGRKSSSSIKTFESSEGSDLDQDEDIPYPAASPNDQEKTDPRLDIPKEDLQAGQVKASFSATGKDTIISTVFVDQILLGDDTKVKTKPPEVGHRDSYQWAEASSRRDSETEEQQKGPSTSSGKEARVDGTAWTLRVADAFPLDIPRIETISDETNQMQSHPQGENYTRRHLMVDPSMSGSSIESNVSSQHSTITEISKSPSGGLIESAGRHTVNLTEHKPSLLSLGNQATSAAQGESTQNSLSVSDRETTELTKTEATSEEVIGQASSQQEEDPALNIEESGQEYTRGNVSVSLPRLPYLVEANDTSPRYHSLVEIAKPASSSGAQSSKHDQKVVRAALLKVPTNVKKQHKSERGSKLNQSSKSQKGVLARADSRRDAEGENHLGNQLLSDVQLNVATETFMPSVGVQTQTEATQTRTTPDEVNLGDNLQQETRLPAETGSSQDVEGENHPGGQPSGSRSEEVPTGAESRQDVEQEHRPGDQTLSDVQLDVDTGTSVSSLGDQEVLTENYSSLEVGEEKSSSELSSSSIAEVK